MQLGDTFILGEGGHLRIVISDPTKHSGCYVIVNLTKDWKRAGKECELNPGDHKWITERCWVSFGDALEVTPIEESRIAQYMKAGQIKQHLPISGPILQKILAAAVQSKALAPKFKKYL